MAKKVITLEQKKVDIDLWIIAIVTFVIFGVYVCFEDQLMRLVKDNSISVLLRLFIIGALQFGIAGLGITIVCIVRKENLTTFGIRRHNSILAIGLSILCFLPYFLLLLFTGQLRQYAPLSIMITDDILTSGLWVKFLGIVVIAIIWGFFEGFNYVVIYDKINQRYPSKSKWIDKGALACALICVLFHPFNTSIIGLLEIASIIILIYGMLLVRKHTNNAWGCIFIFLFLWNAF